MNFIVNASTSANEIANLREAVGWNQMALHMPTSRI